MAAHAALLLVLLRICALGSASGASRDAGDLSAASRRHLSVQPLGTDGSSSPLQARQPLMRSSLEVRSSAASAASALLLALIFPAVTLALAFVAQYFSSRCGMMSRAKALGGTGGSAGTAGNHSQECTASDHVLWHLKEERPLHAPKATQQTSITERDLLDYIQRYFEHDGKSMRELQQVLHQRHCGEWQDQTWLSWSHPHALSTQMHELMCQFHCDGLLDWSRVPSDVLAHTYMQIIVTSGLGTEAMLDEGSEEEWIQSLHRDTMWDWSVRGMKHLFFSKVDTVLVGCIGRKRVVLLPPQALPGHTCLSKVNWCRCDSRVQELRKMSREHGWLALEEYAKDVGGTAFTVCPATYCSIPAGWWHIVRPLDDLTMVLSPSFLRGCWRNMDSTPEAL